MIPLDSKIKSLAIQYLRACAALAVVFYHTGYYLKQYRGDESIKTVFGPGFGSFGVFCFFALSGLLMAVQCRKLPDKSTLFLSHRIIRILPIFWVLCVVRIITAWSNELPAQFDPLTLFLAPLGERDYVLGIEWTLVYEIIFYIYIFVIIAFGLTRFLTRIALIWLCAIFLFAIFRPGFSPMYPDILLFPLSTTCTPFVLGLLIPELLKRRLVNHFYLAAGILLFALGQISYLSSVSNIVLGIGCALIVAWTAALSAEPHMESLLFAKFGDWSFVIYLVHVPIMVFVYQSIGSTLGSGLIWIVSVLIILAVSAIVGFADVLSYRWMKAVVDGLNGRMTIVIPFAFFGFYAMTLVLAKSNILSGLQAPDAVQNFRGISNSLTVQRLLLHSGMNESSQLIGNIDSVVKEGATLRSVGWVNDRSHWMNRSHILLINGVRNPAALSPRDYRGDVLSVFGWRDFLTPVAFNQHLDSSACPSGALAIAVAIDGTGKKFRILGTVTCP